MFDENKYASPLEIELEETRFVFCYLGLIINVHILRAKLEFLLGK